LPKRISLASKRLAGFTKELSLELPSELPGRIIGQNGASGWPMKRFGLPSRFFTPWRAVKERREHE